MQFYNPPVLRPPGATVLALLLYGAFAGWHVWKTWAYPELIAPGLLLVGSFAGFFVWLAGFVFPRLKRKDLPRRKWLYRGIFCGAFLIFVAASTAFSLAWEKLVKHVVLEARVPEPAQEDWVDGALPARYWRQRERMQEQAYQEWRSAVRSVSRPFDSATWITCSLILVTAQFFRPDPPPKKPKPTGPKPPPLPIAEGMKSRVVTDKWWEKYN